MKWNLKDHLQNQAHISWEDNFEILIGTKADPKLSAAFIYSDHEVADLHEFATTSDGGFPAISRRWRLEIVDLPPNATFGNRSVTATFYGEDDHDLDGSTFGEVSVWEHSPSRATSDQIHLEVDFTKVLSQRSHTFGLHVLIVHGVKPKKAIPLGPPPKEESETTVRE